MWWATLCRNWCKLLARAVTGGRVLSTEEVAMGRLEEYFAAWARAHPDVRAVLVVGAPTTLRTPTPTWTPPWLPTTLRHGLYLPALDRTWIRFVEGRQVSSITTRFLEWSVRKLEAVGKKVLVLIWTTLLGTSPKRLGVGSVPTTAESKRAVMGRGSSVACFRSRARG